MSCRATDQLGAAHIGWTATRARHGGEETSGDYAGDVRKNGGQLSSRSILALALLMVQP